MRKQLHFIVVVSVLLVVMTWPTIVHVFDTDTFWLPSNNRDIWMKLWDAMHWRSVLAGTADYFYSDEIFYPNGVSLTFHSLSLPHVLVFGGLQALMPVSNAYSLAYLLIVFSSTLAAYIYLLFLFNNRWLALFGAIVFGFSQHIISHGHQPDINFIMTLPLALYFFHRGMSEGRRKFFIISGLLTGITAYVSIYMLACLIITMGMVMFWFAISRWRQPAFRLGIALMLCLAAATSFPRVQPLLTNQGNLDQALDMKAGREIGNDLLASFVNYRHPVLSPLFNSVFNITDNPDVLSGLRNANGWKNTSYLGFLPILLILLGILRAKSRRALLPWLLVFITFFVLRLGSVLRINDQVFENVLLPKHYLDRLIPPVFEAFYEIDHFQMGLLLPLAVLSCYGLNTIIGSYPAKHRARLVLLCIALVSFEYFAEMDQKVVSGRQLRFISWLQAQDVHESLRLINLPMSRKNSKLYNFFQSITGFPQAEGMISRTPPSAYDYIERNNLLNSWREKRLYRCQVENFDGYLRATDDLLKDGFSHVVLHLRENGARQVRDSFALIPPAYQDRYVEIYRVQDLRDSCANRVAYYQNGPGYLKRFLLSSLNVPRPNESLLSFHSGAAVSEGMLSYFGLEFSDWKELINIFADEQGGTTVSNANSQGVDLNNIATDDRIFWLISSPEQAELHQSGDINTFFSRRLEFCDRVQEDEEHVVERHIDIAYPCELITSDEPFVVEFDNGIQLSDAVVEHYSDKLQLFLWWTVPEIDRHAYSIQVFDAKGERLRQLDDVIDNQPLSRQQIDISTLTPGDYLVNLIVYDYVTKQSQPGTILGNQETFRRELEIAHFTVTP